MYKRQRQYVPGTSRNEGNRVDILKAVNAYRATLNLSPVASSQINSSRFNSFDILVTRAIFVREQRRIELKGQVFNLFGTTNLTGGNSTIASSATLGQILNASNLQQAELAARIVF